jgi:hypothetical protein
VHSDGDLWERRDGWWCLETVHFVFPSTRIHADPAVAHLHDHLARTFRTGVGSIIHDTRGDFNGAAFGGGIDGVGNELIERLLQLPFAAFDGRQIAAQIQVEVKGNSRSRGLFLPARARILRTFLNEAVQINLAESFVFASAAIKLADPTDNAFDIPAGFVDVPERISQLAGKLGLMFQQNF